MLNQQKQRLNKNTSVPQCLTLTLKSLMRVSISHTRTCSSMNPSSACEPHSDERPPNPAPGAPLAPGTRSHGPSTCSQRSAYTEATSASWSASSSALERAAPWRGCCATHVRAVRGLPSWNANEHSSAPDMGGRSSRGGNSDTQLSR